MRSFKYYQLLPFIPFGFLVLTDLPFQPKIPIYAAIFTKREHMTYGLPRSAARHTERVIVI